MSLPDFETRPPADYWHTSLFFRPAPSSVALVQYWFYGSTLMLLLFSPSFSYLYVGDGASTVKETLVERVKKLRFESVERTRMTNDSSTKKYRDQEEGGSARMMIRTFV